MFGCICWCPPPAPGTPCILGGILGGIFCPGMPPAPCGMEDWGGGPLLMGDGCHIPTFTL